jgi:hypothetical protein
MPFPWSILKGIETVGLWSSHSDSGVSGRYVVRKKIESVMGI